MFTRSYFRSRAAVFLTRNCSNKVKEKINGSECVVTKIYTNDNLLAECEALSLSELEQLQGWIIELIEERQDDHLRRKGGRVMDDMRGLMAKAGICFLSFRM